MTSDFPRGLVRRSHSGIQLEAVGPRHGREIVAVEEFVKAVSGCHLAPFNPIGIADPAHGLLPGAMQEHRKQLTAVALHDRFEFPVLNAVIGLDVAERGDQQRNAMPGRGIDGRVSDAMDQLSEPGRAEVEYGAREIDRCMVVEQPARHDLEQRLCDRQFATGRARRAGKPVSCVIDIANGGRVRGAITSARTGLRNVDKYDNII